MPSDAPVLFEEVPVGPGAADSGDRRGGAIGAMEWGLTPIPVAAVVVYGLVLLVG